ncbi:MAG: hypothetical protein KAZ17_01180 [Sphingorhabdus sp.]|nr:hypothetical protein [Sphingorhabdus sp.]
MTGPRWCARALAISLAALAIAPAGAQTFDLRDIAANAATPAADEEAAPIGALDRYLNSSGFRNPVGRYVSSDIWEELLPIVSDETTLTVAKSLITAARHDSDARALSSVLAAYRDGADKEPVFAAPSGPIISVGNSVDQRQERRSERKQERQLERGADRNPWPDAALPPPPPNDDPNDDGPLANDPPVSDPPAKENQLKPAVPDINPRLGARIVSNLATFRSCSGALIQYLDHLAIQDSKTAAWGRVIRRSMGVAALPPDDSCL